MNGTTPHIVQYQGSKRMLAPQILQYMPNYFSRFIEPFAGMAAMSIAVAKNERSEVFIINDINESIVDILYQAIEQPEELFHEYEKVWLSQFSYPEGHVAHFYKIRNEYNDGDKNPAKMLYLLARCVKGSVRYGSNGKFNQSPDKRRNGTSPKTLKQNIEAISFYLKGRTSFFSLDYREILELSSPGDLVYMDPPYQGTSKLRDSRYISGIEFESFVDSISVLNSKGVDFIISYDGSCGGRIYGKEIPQELGLKKVMLNAGLSSQSLLLGKKEITHEALYISRGLFQYLPKYANELHTQQVQYSLFDMV